MQRGEEINKQKMKINSNIKPESANSCKHLKSWADFFSEDERIHFNNQFWSTRQSEEKIFHTEKSKTAGSQKPRVVSKSDDCYSYSNFKGVLS